MPDLHRIKPAQRRGQGISEVFIDSAAAWTAGAGRVYIKRQQDYWCRPLWRCLRRTPTLRRELRGLQACVRLGIRVPQVVRYHEQDGGAELVLAEVPDTLPLDAALAEPGADRSAILHNVASVIGRLHAGGWAHGALYPQHILIGPGPDPAVVLIDLEKARRSPLRRRTDMARLFRYLHGISAAEQTAFVARYHQARHPR